VGRFVLQTWNCFGAAQSLRSVLTWRGIPDAHRLLHPEVASNVAEVDLVCMQEIFLTEAVTFFDKLVHAHKARDENAPTFWPPTITGSGLGIASRWAIRAQSKRGFSRPHASSERLARKGILYVRVAEGEGSPMEIDVITTHMQSGYDPAARAIRARQLAELALAVRELGSPDRAFVICGDFNICGLSSRRDEEYSSLRGALPDFVDLGADEDGPTFHPHPTANALAHRFEADSPQQRIDYVLFRPASRGGPTAASCAITLRGRLEGHGPPTFASDHFALRATLSW
jgi:endonuclease/exonuclease/phosphatase family metal-dependent hydrolase